ncbi:hypothetical protein [Thermoflexus sp.]|uniref:hypothetical protein n=1 Tax=Thermoflexus sp. TaxID=1969742 RepID=UPI0035E44AC7
MDSEELHARVEQLERELILLKHVIRVILAAHRCNPPSFSGQRVDPETVRQVRREIQAEWDKECQQWITLDPRSL